MAEREEASDEKAGIPVDRLSDLRAESAANVVAVLLSTIVLAFCAPSPLVMSLFSGCPVLSVTAADTFLWAWVKRSRQ